MTTHRISVAFYNILLDNVFLVVELKDSLTRVGADIKQRIIDSVKSTWKSLNEFAMAHRTTPQELEAEMVDSVLTQMTHEEEETAETGCKN